MDENHPKPVTRRQFLSSGLLGASAMLAPRIGVASGDRSDNATANESIPCLIFDMAGGSGLPGNFLVGKEGGPEDLLKSYRTLGWDPKASGAYDSRFGLPLAKVSQIYLALNRVLSPGAAANVRMGSFCHYGQDDSSSNPFSIMALVVKSGNLGSRFRNGSALRESLSGGNSKAFDESTVLRPFSFGSFDNYVAAISPPSGLASAGQKRREFLGLRTKAMLEEWLRATLSSVPASLTSNLQASVNDYLKEVSLNDLDPRKDPIFQKAFGITGSTSSVNFNVLAATVAKSVLSRMSGSGVITLGDCDYHTGDQVKGDQRDGEIGAVLAGAIEAAHQLKRPLFFQLITDGGVYSDPGTRSWRGDSGVRCMSVLGMYRPEGAVTMQRLQIGHYTDGEVVDQNTFFGNNPGRVALAAFANYLHSNGKLETLHQFISPGVMSLEQANDVLLFS